MGEIWHGEIERAAFSGGHPVDESSPDVDLRVVSVQRPSNQQIDQIGRELGIDARAIARAHDRHLRARIDRFGDTKFFIVRPARYIDKTEEVQFGELQIITGPGYVALLGRCGIFQLKPFVDAITRRHELLTQGPAAVLHAALDAVVDGYEPVTNGLENDIDEIEDQVFASEGEPLRRIYELIREVIGFQRATDPLERLLRGLVERRDLPTEELRFLRDVHERALSASERAANFRTLLENVMNVNLALETKRLNEVSIAQADQTKKISSWAAILFTPTFVAGVYGMNFKHMPELQWELGYPFALALMAGLGTGLYVIFKRRDWL